MSDPVAYKYADPTEDDRLIYDEDEARGIAAEDPSLILWVGPDPADLRGLVTKGNRLADHLEGVDLSDCDEVCEAYDEFCAALGAVKWEK